MKEVLLFPIRLVVTIVGGVIWIFGQGCLVIGEIGRVLDKVGETIGEKWGLDIGDNRWI